MKNLKYPSLRTLIGMLAILAVVPRADASHELADREADFTWTGTGGNVFWQTPANWTPSGPPGATNEAAFFEAGTANDGVTPTMNVTVNTTVDHVWVGQTNSQPGGNINPPKPAAHNFVINAGVTLTVQGTNHNGYGLLGSGPEGGVLNPLQIESTYHVGTKANVHRETTVTNNVWGDGTLVLDNPNNELNVRQIISNENNNGDDHWAVMNLSGLNTFVANLGRIRVGDGESEPMRRASGLLILAKTNTITLTGINSDENVQLVVGNNDVNNNGSLITELQLGQQTTLNLEEMLVGGRKTIGRMRFNPDLTTPAFTLRGSAGGISRAGKVRIGDHSNQPNTGNSTTGTIDLSGGTVDLRADTIYVGRSSKEGTGPATGTLTLGAGTLDVNDLEVGYQTTDLNTSSTATGTVNVNGTSVVVNDLLRLGRSAGSATARTATLNINAGSVQVNGEYKNEGTANINVTDGYLSLPVGSKITASTVTVNNGAISNVASLAVTNSLTIGIGGIIPGSPAFDLGSGTVGTVWDVSSIPEGLLVNQSLSGEGAISGGVTVNTNATVNPGGTARGGSLTFYTDLTNHHVNIAFDLNTNVFLDPTLSDQILVGGTLVLSGTNNVLLNNLGPTIDLVNNYTLATYGTLVGGAGNLKAAGKLGKSRFTFTFDTVSVPGSILMDANLSGAASLNLNWVGDGGANNWDFATPNWDSGGATLFFNLDNVTFDNSGSASPAVNLTETVSPGSLNVNSTQHYRFGGAGGLDVPLLIKNGTGALTFTNSGNNSFASAILITNGAVTIGNSGLNIIGGELTVAGGSLTFSGAAANNLQAVSSMNVALGASLTVANSGENDFGSGFSLLDGSLTFNQPVDASFARDLAGAGTLTKLNANTLTLSGNNGGLATEIQINAGTVRANSVAALGFAANVANGAALDIRGQSLATTITVVGVGPGGSGALISTGPGHQGTAGLSSVNLAGDAAFGGLGPWDTDPVKNSGRIDITFLSTAGQARKLTKVGSNQVTLRDCLVDPALGDIAVEAGALLFQGITDSMGNSANSLTVSAGATLAFYNTDPTAWDKQMVLNGDGVISSLFNWSGTNTLAGAITLNGNVVLDDGRERASAPENEQLLKLNGAIGGTGGFTKVSVGAVALNGNNNYSGPTIVAGGKFLVNGINSGSGTITVNGGSLGGAGTITSPVTIAAGGDLAPGASIGTLTINNTVSLGGSVTMEVNRTGPANDLLAVSTPLALGGTLVVVNVGTSLQGGETFDLFNSPALSGSFATLQLPPLGAGLSWNTSQLGVNGTLSVSGTLALPLFTNLTYTSTEVVVDGTQGVPDGTYYVLSATDLAQPLASWELVATNLFDAAGNFSFTNAVNPVDTQRYYRIQVP